MFFKHLREELKDAESQGWRTEGRLVARNCIIAAAAAFCPLSVLMAVLALVLSRYAEGMPSIIGQTAFYYPLTAIAGVGLAVWLMSRGAYTGAVLSAILPFAWIAVFLAGFGYWVVA